MVMNYYSLAATAQWFLEGSRFYGARGFRNAATTFAPDDLDVDMRGRVACVTGANSGIGFSVAKSLAERECTVHMLCRNQARGEQARNLISEETGNDDVHLHVVDVSDFRQVESFATSFVAQNPSLNVLVNNAGGMPSERMETPQGHEAIMATMLGGTYLLTKMLLPALENAAARAAIGTSSVASGSSSGSASAEAAADNESNVSQEKEGMPRGGEGLARVINVSSAGMYTVSGSGISKDLGSRRVDPWDPTVVYAFAKRAQVTLTERWAASSRSVRFNSMHPGWADTPGLAVGMPAFHKSRAGSMRSSEEGADTIVWLACSEAAGKETGKFWFDRKARRTHMPWAGTRMSEQEEDALWNEVDRVCSDR